MKKLGDVMGKLNKNVRHKLSVKTYQRPLLFVILTMVFINIVVLVIAALIALIIDDGYDSFLNAFVFGSVTWMLTPNAILSIDQPSTFFLAVVVLMIGIVLFSGTIIALTTNAIKDYFQKKKETSGAVFLQNHIVILNWNNKVPELIADLLYVSSRAVTVLLLAEVKRDYVETKILDAIKKKNVKNLKHLNIIIKEGDPLSQKDLLDVSIEHAETILIMNIEAPLHDQKTLSSRDLNIIKIVLALGQLKLRNDIPIVAEIKQFSTKEKLLAMHQTIASLMQYRLIPICFDKRLGQIIAQTLMQKEMEDIYLALFSFKGSEVYALDDVGFDRCVLQHSHAIPVDGNDQRLFVLAGNNAVKNITLDQPIQAMTIKLNTEFKKMTKTVIVYGENAKKSFIEDALNNYEQLNMGQIKTVFAADLDDLLATLETTSEPHTLLLLSDETVDPKHLDANVIDALLKIHTKALSKPTNIIVELLDPKNDALVKDFDIENTIISNKIISLLLSKLALFPETEGFYERLLSIDPNHRLTNSNALLIHPAHTLIDQALPIHFESIKAYTASVFFSSQKTLMPIGYVRNAQVHIFNGNFSKQPITVDKEDQLILIRI